MYKNLYFSLSYNPRASRRSKMLIKIFNSHLEDIVETILSFSITAYGSQAFLPKLTAMFIVAH